MSYSHLSESMDGTSTVDFMSLLGRCLGNFKIVERAIATFRDIGWSDLNELQAALEREDFDAVVEIAHRFKGAASNVSAVGLSKLLLLAEVAGRERDLDRLSGIMVDLRQAWDGFQKVVNALAPATGGPVSSSHEQSNGGSESNHACARC